MGVQHQMILRYDGAYSPIVALAMGTLAGLMLKYTLDKRYIFRYETRHAGHDALTFFAYASMGIVTTAIFWTAEILGGYVTSGEMGRYAGGTLGLITGYVTKYFLDKRFVFSKKQLVRF